MNVNNALQVIETKYSFEFKEKQIEAINSIVNGKDTFIVLPTGYGKTKIYSHLPEIYGLLNNMMGTILVISPLQSLMLDQVAKMSAIGIDATIVGECQPDKSVATQILKGDFGIVFSSPEAALTPGMWRKCFTSGVFRDNLKAVVIDEAHCITEWGGEFRQEYSRLGELRSICPDDVTFVALTATATKSIRTQILKKLDMIEKEVTTVYQLPDRQNIMYTVKKSRNNFIELQWLLDDIVKNKFNAKKTVVYCRNIATCANLYEHFSMNINQCDNITERLVAMYHRSTAKLNKDHVLEEFPKNNSKLRLVFATVAFGMGVDIPDIDYVVHWGAPRGLEQFAQECGRAGRDGRQSQSIVYFTGHDIAKDRSSPEMRDFCKSTSCLRHAMNSHFKLDTCSDSDSTDKPNSDLCRCCCVCFNSCKCGGCVPLECIMDFASEMPPSDVYDNSVRNLDECKLKLLKANLMDFQECLIEENSEDVNAFDASLIECIVTNCNYLLCEDDIIDLGLLNNELSKEIFLLIEEVC
ncbi:uncharacterized protein LOC127699228 [Mytilus californianus]|uniref:uncharacterized protein LOC127699228 n=1 Tax=Mytilus californianus TaxID=6549 RepID=UPI002246FF70|nr:uncharacterized protein LOC127699228 [Mytilus californianus]